MIKDLSYNFGTEAIWVLSVTKRDSLSPSSSKHGWGRGGGDRIPLDISCAQQEGYDDSYRENTDKKLQGHDSLPPLY